MALFLFLYSWPIPYLKLLLFATTHHPNKSILLWWIHAKWIFHHPPYRPCFSAWNLVSFQRTGVFATKKKHAISQRYWHTHPDFNSKQTFNCVIIRCTSHNCSSRFFDTKPAFISAWIWFNRLSCFCSSSVISAAVSGKFGLVDDDVIGGLYLKEQ